MPYRQLPERGRAREQRDLKIAQRVRMLERRTRYPGARRIVEVASVTVSTAGPTSAAYLQMAVDRGSWLVNAGFNYVCVDDNNAYESVNAEIQVRDSLGAVADDPVGPPAKWTMRGVARTGGSAVRQPFTLFGHGHWEEPVTLELVITVGATTNPAAHDVDLTDMCMLATPL